MIEWNSIKYMSLIYSLKVFQVTGTQIAGFDRALAKTDWSKSMEG